MQVTFSMAVKNMELMHECSLNYFHMEIVRSKEKNTARQAEKSENIKNYIKPLNNTVNGACMFGCAI